MVSPYKTIQSKTETSWLLIRYHQWQALSQIIQSIPVKYGFVSKDKFFSFVSKERRKLTQADIETLCKETQLLKIDITRLKSVKSTYSAQKGPDPYWVSSQWCTVLETLLFQLHQTLFLETRSHREAFFVFFSHHFPQAFRRQLPFFLVAMGCFLMGAFLSFILIMQNPDTVGLWVPSPMLASLEQHTLWTHSVAAAPVQASFLMVNNIRVAINAFVLGVFGGVGTLALLFYNGMFGLGAPLAATMKYGLEKDLLLFMAPHGPIELTTIWIAGSAGLRLGWAWLFPGQTSRLEALKNERQDTFRLLLGCVLLLIIAGLIEGLISLNSQWSALTRICIGMAVEGLFLWYVLTVGRKGSLKL